jgi:hypothetical protein
MVERINAHLMRRLGTTRRALFEAIERATLRPSFHFGLVAWLAGPRRQDPDTVVVSHHAVGAVDLRASSLTYAEATWTQALPDWIGAHVRLFRFLGGVPRRSSRRRSCHRPRGAGASPA